VGEFLEDVAVEEARVAAAAVAAVAVGQELLEAHWAAADDLEVEPDQGAKNGERTYNSYAHIINPILIY